MESDREFVERMVRAWVIGPTARDAERLIALARKGLAAKGLVKFLKTVIKEREKFCQDNHVPEIEKLLTKDIKKVLAAYQEAIRETA